MRRFIIFFSEKEGTTALVSLLDDLDAISIVRPGGAWEPFDTNNAGPMSFRNLAACFRLVYGDRPVDMDRLNGIYQRSAKAPLLPIADSHAVGLKMRFRPPNRNVPTRGGTRFHVIGRATKKVRTTTFRPRMIRLVRELDLTVLVTVRQDVLRWSLSKYHGDGTGNQGHLQFALAKGDITRDDIRPIDVDVDRLRAIIDSCRQAHADKRRLVDDLAAAGVRTQVLRYEDFLADPTAHVAGLLSFVGVEVDVDEIEEVVRRGTRFEKVHAHDISDFVVNHEEVLERVGEQFLGW